VVEQPFSGAAGREIIRKTGTTVPVFRTSPAEKNGVSSATGTTLPENRDLQARRLLRAGGAQSPSAGLINSRVTSPSP
jgi:hypothetical protein